VAAGSSYSLVLYSVQLEKQYVDFLTQSLTRLLNIKVIAAGSLPMGLILEHLDEDRGQIRADELLHALHSKFGVLPYQRVLVVINGDGYVEGLNFVFGIAAEGWGGVVFTERLRPELYHETPSDALFRARLLKEALHELGHSFGLQHCPNNCVMRFSNSVVDVDRKSAFFCSRCVRELSLAAPGLLRV